MNANARHFSLRDGQVTLRRSDGPPCPAWHCIISRPPNLRAGTGYTAREALHTARAGSAAFSLTVASPPPRPAAPATVPVSDTVPLAAVRARIDHACAESMALRHRIGEREPLAALDVLVEQAIEAQHVSILSLQLRTAEERIHHVLCAQERLQKELDALRAQLAAITPALEPQAAEAVDATPGPKPTPGPKAEQPDTPASPPAPVPTPAAESAGETSVTPVPQSQEVAS